LADIFFGINIEYGKRIKDFLELKVQTVIESEIKKILQKCLNELTKDGYTHILEIKE
jgi:hypothetical protein